jgi:hypothetical protein
MANLFAIHSVGDSLVTYLRNSYETSLIIPQSFRSRNTCSFQLISSGELNNPSKITGTSLTLFLYRVTVNEHLRNAALTGSNSDDNAPLSLDLHYLMTIWADGALAEHTILAWAMREIYLNPVLDISSLTPEANWTAGEIVQLIPAELSNEDIMRIWDALEPPYRLSVSYIARVVRIEADRAEDARPVVAARFAPGDREGRR